MVNIMALLCCSIPCSTEDSKAKARTDCNGVIRIPRQMSSGTNASGTFVPVIGERICCSTCGKGTSWRCGHFSLSVLCAGGAMEGWAPLQTTLPSAEVSAAAHQWGIQLWGRLSPSWSSLLLLMVRRPNGLIDHKVPGNWQVKGLQELLRIQSPTGQR